MNFSFAGRHMEIGASLMTHAKEACVALAHKYKTDFIDVSIVMTKDGHLFYTDVTVKVRNGNSYYASDDADEPYVSFDATLRKIDSQIQKKKQHDIDAAKKHSAERVELDNSLLSEEDDSTPLIIAEILDDIPLLSVSDAAKHINDSRHIFVFENISNNAVNVVYRRDDGNIGWIDYTVKG